MHGTEQRLSDALATITDMRAERDRLLIRGDRGPGGSTTGAPASPLVVEMSPQSAAPAKPPNWREWKAGRRWWG